MTYGKVIIATAVGGFKYTIKDKYNGMLVDYGDKEGLLNVILTLVENPSIREKLSKNALDTIDKYYSWDVIAEKTLKCYYSLQGINN